MFGISRRLGCETALGGDPKDSHRVYAVKDDIPIMLVDEAPIEV
jgi:hypothetical protein